MKLPKLRTGPIGERVLSHTLQATRPSSLLHPVRALKEGYDPKTFTQTQLKELWDMSESIMYSLMYYL